MVERILETTNLFGGYGRIEILHNIDLHVDKNEIVCIIGPNGSGKSTFLKVVYGLATYYSGNIKFRTRDGNETILNGMKANQLVRMGIAYVPQRNNVFPNMTIQENLEMGGFILDESTLETEIAKIYDEYPLLYERRNEKARTLSGGQRQLLAISRALVIDPQLIIMDEPSAALQPSIVTEVMERISNLRKVFDKTILIVEQNTRSALNISDRGYIFAAGQVVHENTGYELLHNTDLGYYYLGGKALEE